MIDERMEVKVLGIVLGTATNWEETTDSGRSFYDFEPALADFPKGDLHIDFESGVLQITEESDDQEYRGLVEMPAYGFLKKYVDNNIGTPKSSEV